MSAEIGSRNLGDVQRYNLLPLIGHLMGYDSHAQSNKRSLWKDRAFVELNAAVLSSFDKLGVSVVDHHTASDSFINFANREMSSRGYFTGDWVWLTPPISGSATSVFHQEMVKMALKPAFMGFREPSWKSGNAKGARREKSKGGATRAADPSLSRETDDDHLLASARSIVNISGNITTDSSTTAIDDKSTRGSTQSTLTSSHQSESSVVDSALLENASILVGTETGTAEQLANRFSVNLRKQGVNITPCLIESLQQPLLSHLKQKRIIFVFLSTFGDGELPTEAAKSIQQLATSANGSLSHLSFAVFGLCSSAYPRTFNGAANTLSSTLMVLGATRLGPIGAGDELEDREGAFQQWQQNVFDSIGLSNKRLTTIIDSKSAPNTLASPSNDWIDATITKSTTLFKDGVRGTWHIELAADDLRYNPGDHLAITPLNPAFIVDEAMTLFGTADPSHHKLLHSTVDLMGPCPTNLLFFMRDVAESSGSKSDAAKLDRLLSQSDTKTGTSALSTLDVFRLFKSVIGSKNSKRPALTDFLSYAPTLQPRYYSIASASTGGAALTVSRHHFSRPDGTAAFGLCSEYLIQMPVSSTLRFMVRQCPRFHLQTPLAKPTAMVANGTGIAPFRAFIEQIRDSRKTDGISEALDAPLILYFGCRSIKEFLYRHEIEQALRDGILSKCVVALSRETAPPPSGVKARTIIYRSNCRVQDVVKEDVDGMKGVLLGGAVFVCGARTMGVAVSEACDALAKAELGVKSWTKTAKKAGAFIEDTY
ncbi:hypothetical protein M427DRAFT_53093 [Gonapodya prolifera JEL478]|uniref:nitric-oxide synthase (NADPH) n=1 Tax=Gonapodya prolifera (strain JEL478) TaxID=1344416 RepID=A0A139AQS2_GONPJ|nr:hypothetical protein M427DRAFT_53093 [Gonapodya prolifera JEL478]|eukprot:KXS19111.1 hypothetical protein M427DRAFT_53093 [Gonapodya prolifera JEL478]